MADWHLYILRTAAGHLYTGVTTDVARRFSEHSAGGAKAARSLRGKGPLELVFQHPAGSRSEAQKAEALIKRLPRQSKQALVQGQVSFASLVSGG